MTMTTATAGGPLDGLDEEQRAAAETISGPVVILAGAGTGKTRTVTHRIAHGVRSGSFDPARTMALTFTTRAAAELGRRLSDLGAGAVAARTFHSAALRQLRHFWADEIGGGQPRVRAARAHLVRAALQRCDYPSSASAVRAATAQLERFNASGGQRRRLLTDPDRGLGEARFAQLRSAYADVKTREGVIDFDDVLLILVGLLESRARVREAVRRAYRWFTVDEFQDASPLQVRLLEAWLGERGEACVVGDPAQAIYGFAGGDRSLLETFHRRFPGARVHRLTTSYRCAPQIVAVANRTAVDIPGSLQLRSVVPADATSRMAVQSLRFADADSQAEGVAQEMHALIRGGQRPDSIACLYRTHAQGQAVATACAELEVTCSLRVGDAFFSRAEVREAQTRLRGEARRQPDQRADEAVASVAAAMGLEVPGERDEQRESLAALGALARSFDDVEALVAELDRRMAEGLAPPAPGVALATLHAAKGLEWDTVFIIGLVEGSLPMADRPNREPGDPVGEDSEDAPDSELDEERRLWYVGVTRARRRLVLTGFARSDSGAVASSRFLRYSQGTVPEPEIVQPATGVERALARSEPGPEPRHRSPARCSGCGKALVTGPERVVGRCRICPVEVNPELHAALVAWRDSTASVMGRPGYAVLTEASVLALAQRAPSTVPDLAAIPGFTPAKVAQHGEAILAVVSGARRMKSDVGNGNGNGNES